MDALTTDPDATDRACTGGICCGVILAVIIFLVTGGTCATSSLLMGLAGG